MVRRAVVQVGVKYGAVWMETWELSYAATRTHEGVGVFTSFTYSNTCEFIGTG